jgi:hypothetical protein
MPLSAHMSLENDESQASTPTDLVFILAIAGRLDAQSRIFAENVEVDCSIYCGYAVLDPLYSMFKYFFDACLNLAGYISEKSRLLAQKLDKDLSIYYCYAILDSLSSSYSMFKYFFDVFISSNDPNAMHDLMMTPYGLIAIVAESLFLVVFSFLAAKFDKEKEGTLKKYIAVAWPYFRDVMKALKNAYKGWLSAVFVISFIGGLTRLV